ncbi:mitochondrial-processing peptidase subunit alpha-like [Acropora palmata]|uniref:mitochondrial-processing peptidase subunit alpha-like n=1 Tax=Acropora palmata TaxID=6131 RepID=UPI003DA091CB
MAARNGVPIFRGCRSLRAFHRTSRQGPRKRYLSNGGISPLNQPPLNQPLQDMPPSPASMIGGTESWQNRHDHVTHVTTLENGIRVASEDSFGQFSTIGVVIDAGSRYEVEYPAGLSHLLEKLSFQSTVKYKTNDDITQELEKFGGMADCTSFRDAIIYGTSCFTSGVPTVMEVLSEGVLQPRLNDQEIEEQKMVVQFELENLDMKPDPEPALTDLIHAAAFRDNTVGLPKLCPPENINMFNSSILFDYMKQYYQPSRMVIAGVNVDHQHLIDLTRTHFIHKKPVWFKEGEKVATPDRSITQYTGGMIKDHRIEPRINPGPTPLPELAHLSIGLESCNYEDPDFFAFTVLNTLMGGGGSFSAGGPGKGMYSRLYLNVLNRYHWIYSATAYHHSYADTGLFCIHGSCHPTKLRDLAQVFVKEYFALVNGEISEVEVARAKKQLQSMLMMNLESRIIVFEDIGRQVLGLNKRKSSQELFHSIENVTVEDVKRVGFRMLASKPSVAGLGNLTTLPKYQEVQHAFGNSGNFTGASRFFLFRN